MFTYEFMYTHTRTRTRTRTHNMHTDTHMVYVQEYTSGVETKAQRERETLRPRDKAQRDKETQRVVACT